MIRPGNILRYTEPFHADVARMRDAGLDVEALKAVIHSLGDDDTLRAARPGVYTCPVGAAHELTYYVAHDSVTLVRLCRRMPARALRPNTDRKATTMWGNYLKHAWRNVSRHKGYALINVGGLAVAMACFLMILLFIRQQLTFDAFNTKASRIYRITHVVAGADGERTPTAMMASALAPGLKADFPEVEDAVRVNERDGLSFLPVGHATMDRPVQEDGVLFADASFFNVFSFRLQRGDPAEVLATPDAIVLTRRLATRYFGDDDPVGQTLLLGGEHRFHVTGVVDDPPPTSTIQFSAVAPFDAGFLFVNAQFRNLSDADWSIWSYPSYVLLSSSDRAGALSSKVASYVADHTSIDVGFARDAETGALLPFHLEPLRDVYFSDVANVLGPHGDMRYVYLFTSIAVLVLLVAAINYMNLATARSARRAREVGVRKVAGARRGQLARQFLGEAVLTCTLAAPLAMLVVFAALPLFSRLMQLDVAFRQIVDAPGLVTLGVLTVGLGVASGSYPAMVLSRFRPVQVMSGALTTGRGSVAFRRGLVIFQFTVSVALVVATLGIQRQLEYVRTTNLGLDQEHVVVLPITHTAIAPQATAFADEVGRLDAAQRATVSSSVPTRTIGFKFSISTVQGRDVPVVTYQVDPDFIATYGLDVVRGRGFSEAFATADAGWAVVINETAARALGLDDAVGQSVYLFGRREMKIVGVVKDFHYASLHDEVEPLMLQLYTDRSLHSGVLTNFVSVKLKPGDVRPALGRLEDTWKRFAPDDAFDYFFLDQAFDSQYRQEERLAGLFRLFAFVAIVVAAMGLFGLATFMAEQRTREIGIRKVLGASAASVVALLSKEYVLLVGIAFVIAAPVAYYAVGVWLQAFAYHAGFSWGVFVLAGAAALVVSFLAVGFQSIKAALSNPVNALRHD